MWPNPQFPFSAFTEEILNGKRHFLCSVWNNSYLMDLVLSDTLISHTFSRFGIVYSKKFERNIVSLKAIWNLSWYYLSSSFHRITSGLKLFRAFPKVNYIKVNFYCYWYYIFMIRVSLYTLCHEYVTNIFGIRSDFLKQYHKY